MGGDGKKRSRRVQLETGAIRKDKTPKRSRNVGSERDGRTFNERGVAGLPELVENIQKHLRLHSIPACTEEKKGGGAPSPLPLDSCASIADHALSVLSQLADGAPLSPSSKSLQVSELSLFLIFLLG